MDGPCRSGSDENTPDPATGLTPKEKAAITSSWAIVSEKKDIRANGIELFLLLFREYPYMRSFFQNFEHLDEEALRTNRSFFSHTLTVMYSIGSLVHNLDDADQLVLLINKLARNHLNRGIMFKAFQDLQSMFPKYLVARAGPAATPFVQQSWTKLLTVFNSLVLQIEKEDKARASHAQI